MTRQRGKWCQMICENSSGVMVFRLRWCTGATTAFLYEEDLTTATPPPAPLGGNPWDTAATHRPDILDMQPTEWGRGGGGRWSIEG